MAKRQYRLTTKRILAWADAHYKRTGRWPTYRSGQVFDAPEENWSAIDGCLEYGGFGLPGGSSLNYLLARHRGFIRGKERPKLSIKLILVWADRHYIRTGDWPTSESGRVEGIRGESWKQIDVALHDGRRGLPRESSLVQLLAKHRGKALGRRRPLLTVNQIIAWADKHHKRTGRWPSATPGLVKPHPGESWKAINYALYKGFRGLPGRTSLSRLLAKHRRKPLPRRGPKLTITRILTWADRHRARKGRWPSAAAGPVKGVPGESWRNINEALSAGRRGLVGASSIAKLLVQRRRKRHHLELPLLTEKQILAWADEHHRRTDRWPAARSGPVHKAPDETWGKIELALRNGWRGLPGGTSIAVLLARRRGKKHPLRKPLLTEKHILAWADEHERRTGRRPTATSGPVHKAPDETWGAIARALRTAVRGLPGGSSLSALLVEHRGKKHTLRRPPLTEKQILAWADEHYRRTGAWPTQYSGSVRGAPDEAWGAIDKALKVATRGLPGGFSVGRLLAAHRGKKLGARGAPHTRTRSPVRARTGRRSEPRP